MNLFLFIDDNDLTAFLKRPRSYNATIFDLKKYFKKFTVVNISKIIGEDVKNNNFKKILDKKKVDYFCPSNQIELIRKIDKTKNYGFFKAKFDLKYYNVLRALNKSNIRFIQVSNYSFIFEKNSLQDRTINENLRVIFKIKLMNYFHRFMCALNLYPKVHIHFDCDQKRIDLINSSFSKKIDRLIPIINLSYYKSEDLEIKEYKRLFEGENFEKRLDNFYEKEDSGDDIYNLAGGKIASIVSYWYFSGGEISKENIKELIEEHS